MSVNSFIPVVWAGELLMQLMKATVYGAALANRNYEGEISGYGDTVKINSFGDIDIGNYTGADISFQSLDTAEQELAIDQRMYFAFTIDDVDGAQVKNKGALRAAAMQQASYRLRDTMDQFIAAKYSQAGIIGGSGSSALGTTATAIEITADGGGTSTKPSEYLSRIARRLDDANVPLEGRRLVIPPWFNQKCIMEKLYDIRGTNNDSAYANGRVANAFTLDLYMSNNVPTSSTKNMLLGGNNSAITLAEQIVKTTAGSHEKSFGDYVKGLHVYGAKVIRADSLLLGVVTEGAEGQA